MVSGWRCAATAYDAAGPRVDVASDRCAVGARRAGQRHAHGHEHRHAQGGSNRTPEAGPCHEVGVTGRPLRRAAPPGESWCPRAACSKYRAPAANCQLSSQFANISLVVPDADASSVASASLGLGAALRRAWLGYQLRLDRAMAEAGFGERKFPDGRVLRVCSGEAGSTISAIGRELGITRQGASKVVAHLRDRGYVTVADSTTSKREKSVILTPRGIDYLAHQRSGCRPIDDELRAELGEAALSALGRLLDALDAGEGCACERTCGARPASSECAKQETPTSVHIHSGSGVWPPFWPHSEPPSVPERESDRKSDETQDPLGPNRARPTDAAVGAEVLAEMPEAVELGVWYRAD